jgi:NDP-sugar pyrophosphorylase family protein
MVKLPVAILAGGLGTRLLPVTESVPKVLVPVAGKPFLAHQLALLRDQGVRRVVLCVGHLGNLVAKEFGDGGALGIHIEYSFDGPKQIGTGGAIRQALSKLGEKFFVLNGDSYLPAPILPIEEFFEKSPKQGVMAVFRNYNLWDASNVVFQHGEIRAFDKSGRTPNLVYIDYGLSIFRSSAFANWPEGSCFDMTVVNNRLIQQNQLAGFEMTERFYEIGSFSGLSELNALLQKSKAIKD